MLYSEEINELIADNGGNERDALTVMYERNKLLSERVKFLESLIEHGLTEEEYSQSLQDHIDTMRMAL